MWQKSEQGGISTPYEGQFPVFGPALKLLIENKRDPAPLG